MKIEALYFDDIDIEVEKIIEEKSETDNLSDKLVENFGLFDPKLKLGNFQFPSLDILKKYDSEKINIDKQELEENKDKIKLFYLPPYCPDLNPDEYLNCDLKTNANKKSIPRNKDELKKNTIGFMRSIQKQPERVKKYFLHKSINYAA